MKHALILGIPAAVVFTAAVAAQAPAAKPAAAPAARPAAEQSAKPATAQPAKPAATPAAAATPKEVILNATSANVKESGTPVKIRIFRWSNDQERTPIIAALTAPPPSPARAGGGRGGGGRGGGGARGAANADGAAGAPARGGQAGAGGAQAAAGAARGGQAGAGGAQAAAGAARGGRGGRGRGGAPAAPLTPIEAFTEALQKAPTVGYIWTTDVTGYSIKYAWHATQPDGSERIVLATDRRLGAYSPAWTLKAAGQPTDYDFTLLDLRLDAKGGEAKSSLTTKIVADNQTKQLGLENYASAPVILQNVKR